MTTIRLTPIDRTNWRAALALDVRPEQRRFIADYFPVAAIALAKAYIRPGGMLWLPYGVLAESELVGFLELACRPDTADGYWLYHFFIDRHHQGKGYGRAALDAFLRLVQAEYAACRTIQLTVHPENSAAQRLYTAAGFTPTGEIKDGEPLYTLAIGR